MIINAENFALSVVSSSSSELSIEEKAKLYEEAYDFIVKRNTEQNNANKLSPEEQHQRSKQLKNFLG